MLLLTKKNINNHNSHSPQRPTTTTQQIFPLNRFDKFAKPTILDPSIRLEFAKPTCPLAAWGSGIVASGSMFFTLFIVSFFLFLSLPILFLLALRFLSPLQNQNPSVLISPSDELNDLSLFDRAFSLDFAINTHLSTGPNPKLKIIFLFLPISDLHFTPLWERFFNRNFTLWKEVKKKKK